MKMQRNISVERGEIEFDHVWFKYKEEAKEYVLSDVSFHIKAGQTVGLSVRPVRQKPRLSS